MFVDPNFTITGIGSGAGGGVNDDITGIEPGTNLEDLAYGLLLGNSKINVFQLIVTALIFLTVVAWVQFFFIYLDRIDSVNIDTIDNTILPLQSERILAQKKSRQLKFAIILTIVTAILYFIYTKTNSKKK